MQIKKKLNIFSTLFQIDKLLIININIKDVKFEDSKKIITKINGPTMLHTDQPIPYNSLPLIPRHQCNTVAIC